MLKEHRVVIGHVVEANLVVGELLQVPEVVLASRVGSGGVNQGPGLVQPDRHASDGRLGWALDAVLVEVKPDVVANLNRRHLTDSFKVPK